MDLSLHLVLFLSSNRAPVRHPELRQWSRITAERTDMNDRFDGATPSPNINSHPSGFWAVTLFKKYFFICRFFNLLILSRIIRRVHAAVIRPPSSPTHPLIVIFHIFNRNMHHSREWFVQLCTVLVWVLRMLITNYLVVFVFISIFTFINASSMLHLCFIVTRNKASHVFQAR